MPSSSPPHSPLRGAWPVGAGWFARAGLVREGDAGALVASLDAYEHPGFSAAGVHPDVRRFYEDTDAMELFVRARWRRGFGLPGRLFIALARPMGNLVLPRTTPPGAMLVVRSRVVPLRAEEARQDPRGSVRTYADGGAMYVASYAVHRRAGVGYMNIALPVPGANLTSVLRMDALGSTGGITLTSLRAARDGDEGIFLVSALGSVRVPLSEELLVWPVARSPSTPEGAPEGAALVARHTFRVLGLRCLELDYAIRARAG